MDYTPLYSTILQILQKMEYRDEFDADCGRLTKLSAVSV